MLFENNENNHKGALAHLKKNVPDLASKLFSPLDVATTCHSTTASLGSLGTSKQIRSGEESLKLKRKKMSQTTYEPNSSKIGTLHQNEALGLDVANHTTIFNQSECLIFA